MAKKLILTNDAVNAQAVAVGALLNDGYIRVKTAADGLLAELRFNSTAFNAPSSGVMSAFSITPAAAASGSGTAAKYEAYKSDGATLIWTGTVGLADADLVLNSVTVSSGAQVSITSMAHTVPKSS